MPSHGFDGATPASKFVLSGDDALLELRAKLSKPATFTGEFEVETTTERRSEEFVRSRQGDRRGEEW